MRNFLSLLRRFQSDERGAFIVIFGLLAIVLVATAGAVVDFTTIEQARARAQDALDSAALGLQPRIFDDGITEEALRSDAEDLLIERLADNRVTAGVDSVVMNPVDGTLRLNANITVPTAFVSLIGFNEVTARVVSEATRKRLNVEVAMVLDNSGSMAQQNRMTNLKAAARCAMNILFNGDCDSAAADASAPTVKIGIVPFASLVNVGTAYATASWMDTSGASSIANHNFDDDERDDTPFTGTVNRFTLYNQLNNVSWRGCVEARPYPYDTDDTPPDPLNPDTLFVPQFAPDNPGTSGSNTYSGFTLIYGNSYLNDSRNACRVPPTWQWTQVKRNCNISAADSWWRSGESDYNSASCSGTTSNSYGQTNEWGNNVNPPAATAPANHSAASYYNEGSCTSTYSSRQTQSGRNPRYENTRVITCVYDFSDREKQERLCKYGGSASTSGGRGPNWDCPSNALLPLTNTKSLVSSAISAMEPQTYTNIHQGAVWGFHMLTPGEPLTEAREFTTATYKVMILMTDGENTVQGYSTSNMNRAMGYMAYGFPGPPVASGTAYNGRLFSTANPTPNSESAVTEAMNARTLETCANAKTAGITIYTIGLNAPNTTTEDMLRGCATSPGHAYFPTQSSELITVFSQIASQLSNLRLAM